MRKPTPSAVAALLAGPFLLGLFAGAAFELAGRTAAPRRAIAAARPALVVSLPETAPAALEIELAALRHLR